MKLYCPRCELGFSSDGALACPRCRLPASQFIEHAHATVGQVLPQAGDGEQKLNAQQIALEFQRVMQQPPLLTAAELGRDALHMCGGSLNFGPRENPDAADVVLVIVCGPLAQQVVQAVQKIAESDQREGRRTLVNRAVIG